MNTAWYIFMILVSTTTPPTIFAHYTAVPIPWSFADQATCENAKTWSMVQLAAVAPPAPGTKQAFVCVQIP